MKQLLVLVALTALAVTTLGGCASPTSEERQDNYASRASTVAYCKELQHLNGVFWPHEEAIKFYYRKAREAGATHEQVQREIESGREMGRIIYEKEAPLFKQGLKIRSSDPTICNAVKNVYYATR